MSTDEDDVSDASLEELADQVRRNWAAEDEAYIARRALISERAAGEEEPTPHTRERDRLLAEIERLRWVTGTKRARAAADLGTEIDRLRKQ